MLLRCLSIYLLFFFCLFVYLLDQQTNVGFNSLAFKAPIADTDAGCQSRERRKTTNSLLVLVMFNVVNVKTHFTVWSPMLLDFMTDR